MTIKQGTEEWLKARLLKIGGSEIYTLIYHYCAEELRRMGFILSKERPFRSIQELFLKIVYKIQLNSIDEVHSQFGNGMEPYIAYHLAKEVPQLDVITSQDFIINESIHKLASCSPDGYITIKEGQIEDFDKTCKIDSSWGRGMAEFKTSNYFANFDEGGSKLQYIIQLVYNAMLTGCKWGTLAVLTPKEKQFNEPLFKGRILEKAEKGNFKEIDQYYDLNYYIYPELQKFRDMIIKSLNAFQKDIDDYDEGRGKQEAFPRNSEDLKGLEREKQLWGQLWPEHFGTKELEEETILNSLLNERAVAKEQNMFAKQALDDINNQIMQEIEKNGFGKYCQIKGIENRITWTKTGQIRFYSKIK